MRKRESERADRDLIQDCLHGSSDAWEVLFHRYKRFVYSIPARWGLNPEDSDEVFQAVWVDCLRELSSLKSPETFGAWLKQIALRKCYRYSSNCRFSSDVECTSSIDAVSEDPRHHIIEQFHREQVLRTAIAELDCRSQQIIRALFFEDPVPSYAVLAERIGMAENSIGFQRDRSLKRLEKVLLDRGYKS